MPITCKRKVMSSHLLIQGPAFAGYCYSHPNCWSDFAPPWIAHALHIKDPITHYLAAFWTLDANHCCISPINCLLIGCPRNEGRIGFIFRAWSIHGRQSQINDFDQRTLCPICKRYKSQPTCPPSTDFATSQQSVFSVINMVKRKRIKGKRNPKQSKHIRWGQWFSLQLKLCLLFQYTQIFHLCIHVVIFVDLSGKWPSFPLIIGTP